MSITIPIARVEILRGLWMNDDDFQDNWTVAGGSLTTDGEIATLTIEENTVSVSKPCSFNSAVHKYCIINCVTFSAAQWQFKVRRTTDQVWVVVATFTENGLKTMDISTVYSGGVDMICIEVSGTSGQSGQYDYVIIASQTMLVPTEDKDVLDLRVHLGFVEEVGSYELSMQNFESKYTEQVAVGNWVKIWIGRLDSSLIKIFTGRVEEVEFDASSTENYVTLRGRDRGEELFRRTVTKIYENTKAETVVKDLINNFTTLKHVRGAAELIENTDTTYTLLEYENTPVFDILKDLAKSAEKDGVIGFDFRTAWDGKFEFFKRNSKTSPINLTNHIEIAQYRKDIHRIRNKITVYGAAEKSNPSDMDAWTEDLVVGEVHLLYYENGELYGWWEPVGDCALAKDNSVKIVGSYSVKLYTTQPVGSSIVDWYFATNHLLNANEYPNLTFQFRRESLAGEFGIKIELWDMSNQKVRRIFQTIPDKWTLLKFNVGEKNDSEWIHDEWNTQDFNWSQIRRIRFEAYFQSPGGQGSFWIDNLFFNSKRWESTQEDIASQQAYGLREYVEVDEELHSDNECVLRAKSILSHLKDPAEYITLQSDALDLENGRLLPGDTIHVSLPNENINGNYRIISIEYHLIAKEQTFRISLELGKEPPLLSSLMSNLRSKTESLARYKAGPTGVSGVGGGNSGGNNGASATATYVTINDETANLPNSVRHVNISEAEKHTPKLHKDAHKAGGEDSFSSSDLLNAIARVKVRKNSEVNDVGARRRLNLIEGSNVTLTVADDPAEEEIDVTITANSGGASFEDIWTANKHKTIIRPSPYDVVSSTTYVTRESDFWKLYAATNLTAPYFRSKILASDVGMPSNFFDKNPMFLVEFYIDYVETGLTVYIVIVSSNEAVPTDKKFGLKIVGTTIYIVSSDGVSESLTSLGSISAGYHSAKVKLDSVNDKVQVWLDNSASPIEKTTNIPNGAPNLLKDVNFAVRHQGLGEVTIYVKSVTFLHDN